MFNTAGILHRLGPRTLVACFVALGGWGLGSADVSANGGAKVSRGQIKLRLTDPARVSTVNLIVNKSSTLQFDKTFTEALIASPDIADVVPLTDQSLYIIGKRIGTTRLTVVDTDKKLIGVVEIEVGYDTEALQDELKRNVPGGRFNLRTSNGRLVLGGSVPDAISLSRALDITDQFTAACGNTGSGAGSGGGSIGGGGPIGAGAAAAAAPGRAASGGATASAVSGAAATVNDRQQLLGSPASGAQQFNPLAASGGRCYANALTVKATQQVMVEVRFVEAQRTASRDLGFSWDVGGSRFRGVTGAVTPTVGTSLLDAASLVGSTGFPSSGVPFGAFVARVLDAGTKADVLIKALEQRGTARRLAEPNLVTMSGDTASFLAGGEFPFPVQADNNRITLEFKKFGIGLAFTPTVLAEGQINLKIEPEVSDLDPNNTFTLVNGISVPSLVVRRANTTIELRDGQSFAIAGLLQTKHTKNNDQLPWLGQVPVLGTLFRSASYAKEESDLVIIVTPRLIQPAVPGQRLATPLDQTAPGNDRDFFLRGQHEVPRATTGAYGHILERRNSWASTTKPSTEAGHVIQK